MAKGSVKWFNNTKGFGFIIDEESNEEVFVHYSGIVSDGYKTLQEGAAVEYDLIDGKPQADGTKKKQAVNVTVVK